MSGWITDMEMVSMTDKLELKESHNIKCTHWALGQLIMDNSNYS